MKKFLFALTLIAISYAGLIWSGWGERKSWNQKVTIEVETPQGIVSNSTIISFVQSKYPERLNSKKSSTMGMYGEAPFIEVKPGKYAFALTLYEMYAIFHEYALHYGIRKGQTEQILERMLSDAERPEIKGFFEPPFFIFRDIEDPKSIKQITHGTFDWYLGSGVKFKSITYQLTDEPRTRGEVNKIAPWVSSHRGRFIKSEPQTINGNPNVAGFNRSILTRHWSCTIDDYMMNNLTYGMYRNGINCGL